MNKKIAYQPSISRENFVFSIIFFGCFGLMAHIMGVSHLLMTLMRTANDLLINVCFYIMAISVLAGAISGLFSEFGVIALVHHILSRFMKPVYDLPGAASLGVLNCYLSDNPSILTLTKEANFLNYFKQYQLPALTNLGTSFGMGLIITTTMVGLDVPGAVTAALIGNVGAIVGSIISVRMMLYYTRKQYGTTALVENEEVSQLPDNTRIVRQGTYGTRLMEALLDGGKVGVQTGMAIIPGVITICSIVMLLTNGPSEAGTYTGGLNEGIPLLPYLGDHLSFIIQPLFGFSFKEALAVPITALGSAGAAIGLVGQMSKNGLVQGNDIAVFTAICMCWSGYLSTHIAMMDALGTKEMTGKAILSHTIGGICAGISAHWIYLLLG
ncbi:CD0519/CD1768 family membrane protein [Atopobacter phocae]|uniref:CD0519/CD1768 family membrane protein n=1 Tax=Atopobacter phocae TaxID=136492 RepID=UPI00046E9636|nr:hypothetical protein [Atopobacter phocae]